MTGGEFWIIKSSENIRHLTARLEESVAKRNVVTLNVANGRTRTSRQRNALEVWCRQVADLLNDAGITREVHSSIFKLGSLEVDWSQSAVKNEIWRPVQIALCDRESTTDATTVDYVLVHDALVRAFASKGISLPAWPVREEQK